MNRTFVSRILLLTGSRIKNMRYNWQHKDWANFSYNRDAISDIVVKFSELTGEMNGILQGMDIAEQQEEVVRFMISEAVTTSGIEGEFISRQDVMSSIKNRMGLNAKPEHVKDRRAKAVSELLIAVRNSYNKRLTGTDIKRWHELLFESHRNIRAGKWRAGKAPMQIVSGTVGRETVHYEAPPSAHVAQEMKKFVEWYNDYNTNANATDALVKTAIAHLYFESIHPFEDGNGRIGRAIAEKCLAQSLNRPVLLSLSSVIEKNKKQYYAALKDAQSSLEITGWLVYFSNVILQAQTEAVKIVGFSLQKTKFFDKYKSELNTRAHKVVKKMLDAGYKGFEGGMTAKKYMTIAKTSKATATRDLQHLSGIGALSVQGGGRSIHYELTI
jgi:Fic family protein